MIAIIGASIQGLITAYFLSQFTSHKITILDHRSVGEQLTSQYDNDYLLEHGSTGIYLSNGLPMDICKKIGIDSKVIFATKHFSYFFVPKDKYLVKVTNDINKITNNSLLFFSEKYKFKSALNKCYSLWETISTYDALKHIFGDNFASYFGSIFSRSIFYSEAEDISFAITLKPLFNRLKQLTVKQAWKEYQEEQQEINSQRKSSLNLSKKQFPYISFENGMSTFVQALKTYLKNHGVQFENNKVVNITQTNNQYFVHAKSNQYGPYQYVIFAVHPQETGSLLKQTNKPLANKMNKIPEKFVTWVYHIWGNNDFSAKGYGIFPPRNAKLPFLHCVFINNLFPNLYPKDSFVVRSCFPGKSELFSDKELIKMSLEAMNRITKVKKQPIMSKVIRTKVPMIQYEPNFPSLKKEIISLASSHKNMYFHGIHYQGFAIDEIMEEAYSFVNDIIK